MDQTTGKDRVTLTVPMVNQEIVVKIKVLHELHWG